MVTIAETAQVEVRVCHGRYGPTINGRLLTDRTDYTRPLRSFQVRSVLTEWHSKTVAIQLMISA